MAKAQQLIREIETHHLVFYQSKPRMSFDIVKTDYFIRKGNYAQGEKTLHLTRSLAIPYILGGKNTFGCKKKLPRVTFELNVARDDFANTCKNH